jgi:hypothetical protein
MQLTLLQYVQNILSALDSDEVNSISDTTESLQVAEIVRTAYFNILNRIHLPEHKQFIQFTGSDNVLAPVLMTFPTGVADIEWVKYFNSNASTVPPGTTPHGVNLDIVPTPAWTTTSSTTNTIGTGIKVFTVSSSALPVQVNQGVTAQSAAGAINGYVLSYSGSTLTIQGTSVSGTGSSNSWNIFSNPAFGVAVPGYQDVTILPVLDFINIVTNFNPTDSDVAQFTFTDSSVGFPGNFTIYYKNSRQPFYCTVISDNYILFDSYDNKVDSTLQASKCMAYGQMVPTWQFTDTFIPLIDEVSVPLLLNEAKSLAFFELKQMPHTKAEQEAKRQWSSVQRDKSKSDKPSYFDQFPNFGRWGRSSFSGLSYFKMRGWDRP